MTCSLEYNQILADGDYDFITNKLIAEAAELAQKPGSHRYGWLLRDLQRNIIAGLVAFHTWEWFYIDLFWVNKDHRRQGWGGRLLASVEAKAKELNCVGLHTWTQSWQAPEFFSRFGYEKYYRLSDIPRGHMRYGYRKFLADA